LVGGEIGCLVGHSVVLVGTVRAAAKPTGVADGVAGCTQLKGFRGVGLADGDGWCAAVDQVQKPGAGCSEQDDCRDVPGDPNRHRSGETGWQGEAGGDGVGGGVAGYCGALRVTAKHDLGVRAAQARRFGQVIDHSSRSVLIVATSGSG
jgi:hypothetical protein